VSQKVPPKIAPRKDRNIGDGVDAPLRSIYLKAISTNEEGT